MANREERIQIIQDTLTMCKEHAVLKEAVESSISGQKIYWGNDEIDCGNARFDQPAWLLLSKKRTMEAASYYAGDQSRKVCVLNFASAVTPGGSVLRGIKAQDESICRISTLYPALADPDTAMPFYEKHREWIRNGIMSRKK